MGAKEGVRNAWGKERLAARVSAAAAQGKMPPVDFRTMDTHRVRGSPACRRREMGRVFQGVPTHPMHLEAIRTAEDLRVSACSIPLNIE